MQNWNTPFVLAAAAVFWMEAAIFIFIREGYVVHNMKRKAIKTKKGYGFLLFVVLGIFSCPLRTEAKADFSDYERVRHPLIQTTNIIEEYEALESLGFLNTGVRNTKTAREDTEEVLPEYSTLLQSLQRENAYEKAHAAIVQINMGKYYGSGILWSVQNENLVIASNRHLLKEGMTGTVTFCNGVSTEGTVKGLSDIRDIGFMEVPLSALTREDWLILRFADKDMTNYEKLQPGDFLFVIGSATGVGADYYEGTIGNVAYYFPEFQSDMLHGYCQAMPGMSGGGTFAKNGSFIGMLTAGTEEGEIASLPLQMVMEEYEKVYGY